MSYPTSVKAFTTKVDGPGNTILAAHINDLQTEVTAIETDLIAGLPVARGGTGATSLSADRVAYTNAGGTALTSAAGFTFDGTTFTAPATAITGALSPAALVDISGAAAGQVRFPAAQNASADVNTLDDYEEGTWTPALGGSGGQSGQAYSVQLGKYVKVGKLVTAYFHIQLSTLGTVTTSAQIQGLPFTTENTSNLRPSLVVGYWANFTTNNVCVSGFAVPNGTAIELFVLAAAGTGMGNMVQGDLSNTSILVGSITYAATA